MQTIFEREFRREKTLELSKRQAELKKPAKKDNNIIDKKQEKLNHQLNDLEEYFFKHVADDNEHMAAIKQRGDNLNEDQ